MNEKGGRPRTVSIEPEGGRSDDAGEDVLAPARRDASREASNGRRVVDAGNIHRRERALE